MKKTITAILGTAAMLVFCFSAYAQNVKPQRPKITGIAHISLYSEDLDNAAALFKDYLGFGDPYFLRREGKPTFMFIKVNDRQYIEFVEDKQHRLIKYKHTAFETDDVEGMRLYLRSMGIVVPDQLDDVGTGFKSFFCKDFNGHDVEFVQYTSEGLLAQHKGENMPSTRISDTMRHVGWTCQDSPKDLAFYGYILGFTEFWRGGEDPSKINWIKMRLPDSKDYVELMLIDHDLNQEELGLYNHLDFDMDDVQATKNLLDTRRLPAGCRPAGDQSKGVCGYGLSNVYLPDDTRIELMTKIALGGTPSASTYGVPLRFDGVQSTTRK